MGDVIAWSKLNKITKMVKNLPTSLATNFGEVKDSISGLVSNFDGWKAPWTSARASKLDKVDAIANDTHSVWNSIPSGTDSVAKQTTLNTVNSTLNSVNSNMAKDATVAKESTLNSVNTTLSTMKMPDSRNYGIKSFTGCNKGPSFTVNGKGLLFSAIGQNGSALKITVDNKVIFKKNRSGGSGNQDSAGYFARNSAFVVSGYNTPYASLKYPCYGSYGSYSKTILLSSAQLTNVVPLNNFYSVDNQYNYFTCTDVPIEFNESVVIEADSGTTVYCLVGLL